MNSLKKPLIALALFAFALSGCSPVKEAGAWKLDQMKAAVVFYYVEPGKNPDETKLREIANEIANDWRKNWRDVQVLVFYDKEFAKMIAGKDQIPNYVGPDGIRVNRDTLVSSSLNPPGGAYLRLSDKNPQVKDWAFIGKELARKM